MTRLAATVEPLDAAEAADTVRSISLGGSTLWPTGTLLLATLTGGVTWGWCTDAGEWVLGDAAAPDICPPLELDQLMEVRIFDRESETLVWRDDGELAGRRLADGPTSADLGLWEDGPDAPALTRERTWVLAAERPLRPPALGFTVVGTTAGARAVVPLEITEAALRGRVLVTGVDHFAVDGPSAWLAATRLTGLMAP